jgi:hypothetical protein
MSPRTVHVTRLRPYYHEGMDPQQKQLTPTDSTTATQIPLSPQSSVQSMPPHSDNNNNFSNDPHIGQDEQVQKVNTNKRITRSQVTKRAKTYTGQA